jgi:hypothetical protein
MLTSGHWGGHLSSAAAEFVARYVSPLVRAQAWSPNLVLAVREGGIELPEQTQNKKDSDNFELFPRMLNIWK